MTPAPALAPTPAAPRGLADGFGRRIDYLCVSVADRCDLRCGYCMPKGFEMPTNWLRHDDMTQLVGLFARLGVSRVRLTGGEPALGVITSMSRHFCAACNRVRLGVDGILYLCLGQQARAPLGRLLRAGASDAELEQAIRAGIVAKLERQAFRTQPERIVRFMSQTEG